MNKFLADVKDDTNFTKTENNAVTHETTKSDLLDLFSMIGALRKRNSTDIENLFIKAFNENSKYALKTLFWARDIRGGIGERRTFRIIIQYLANNHSDRLRPLIKYIPEYGRWDDLYNLFDTKLEKDVILLLRQQYVSDIKSDKPSLLGKWLKSENASSIKSRVLARKLIKLFNTTPKRYRQNLERLRTKIDIIEKKLSTKQYNKIEYDKIPSNAGLKYKKAFYRNDETRYNNYLSQVKTGEKKINVSTLFPYDIAGKILSYNDNSDALDVMWNNLPNYVNEKENALVVADTSGSMNGLPMNVAVSLAIYFAERNTKGPFHNHFITFSHQPKLQEIKGRTLYEKMRTLSRAEWDCNTDIEAMFKLILKTAITHKLKQNEIPKRLYIISDMEFDACTRNTNLTNFENAKQMFNENGYKLPELVFWNVDSRQNQSPITINDKGVQLVSGCSPIIFKQIVSGVSAYDLMMKMLNNDRYNQIE